MKHVFQIITCVCLMACLASCALVNNKLGKKPKTQIVQKKLTPGVFNSVYNYSEWDVSFVQADSSFVLLKGDAEIVNDIEVKLDGANLSISKKKNAVFSHYEGDVKIIISSPNLQHVDNSGTGDFECKGVVYAEKLSIDLSGTGDVDFSDIECNSMTVKSSGTGDFDAKRINALSFKVWSVGTGDVEAVLQKADESDLVLYGTGDVKVKFIDCGKASCELSGTGDMELSGHLKQLLRSVTGTGDLDASSLKVM